MPPPNITGQLHMGHALFTTLQDILIRSKRMQGHEALWLPGTDHAGLATEEKIRERMQEEGLPLTEETFLAKASEWRDSYHTRITTQLRQLGCSCDWSRERFTLDPQYQKATRKALQLCQEQGMLYPSQGDWFLDMRTRASELITALEDGTICIQPASATKGLLHMLRNIEPWCISRQIWWGHKLPIWSDATGNWCLANTQEEAAAKLGSRDITCSPDKLDTWFSSSLWPFAILGWPDHTEELQRFYPAQLIETGGDILFFWCARMLMMGKLIMGDWPFRTIYLHGLIRDKFGKKMSKTAGNGIDPLEMIQTYGIDAIRWALAESSLPGLDTKLDPARLGAGKKIGTKLWNAARLTFTYPDPGLAPSPQEEALLEAMETAYLQLINSHQFAAAADYLRKYLYDEYANGWLEQNKPSLQQGDQQAIANAYYRLRKLLLWFHPIIPYHTEELWGKFNSTSLIGTRL